MRTARPFSQPTRRSRATPARKATACCEQRHNSIRKLGLEPLERRLLLTSSFVPEEVLPAFSGASLCNCPACTGVGLDEIPVVSQAASLVGGSTSLAGLPSLSSNPGAAKKLYLDFNGHYQSSWGTFPNVSTPAFDQNGDPNSLSSGELAAIREIWTRVAEDYAPFSIDVTTIDPGSSTTGIARVAIGGHYSDWYKSSAGGVAYVGGFTNSMPNVAYVFENALGNGNPRYVAEAVSHEAGHLFGLQHQAVWSGSTMVESYNSGSGSWAPIMGTGYYADRTTWHRGPTSAGASSTQDDVSILASTIGWRPDDVGDTMATARRLSTSSVNVAGIIGSTSDVDMWSFTTGGGVVSLQVAGAQYGGNLDVRLELRNGSGQTVAVAAPSTSLGATLSATVGSGTYYVAVRSTSGYANMGQYALRGTLPAAGAAVTGSPEIGVRMSSTELSDGSIANFGSTRVGTSVSRTFTITNRGSSTLTLQPLSSSGLPSGFSLVSNLTDTTLSAGQSTSFTVRFNATIKGTFSGQLAIRSNDANEGVFDVRLTATASTISTTTQPTPTTPSTSLLKRTVDNGATGFAKSGAWTTRTGIGVASDLNQATLGTGSTHATWSFTSIPNGTYQVYGSWTGASANASNAPFTLYNGSTPVITTRVSQRVNSAGVTAEGASWKLLGTVQVTGGRLNVRLSNQADGTIIADAIRIVQTAGTSASELVEADLGLLAWLSDAPDAAALPTSLTPGDEPQTTDSRSWLDQLVSTTTPLEFGAATFDWSPADDAEPSADRDVDLDPCIATDTAADELVSKLI
jgi:hypothetical protein